MGPVGDLPEEIASRIPKGWRLTVIRQPNAFVYEVHTPPRAGQIHKTVRLLPDIFMGAIREPNRMGGLAMVVEDMVQELRASMGPVG